MCGRKESVPVKKLSLVSFVILMISNILGNEQKVFRNLDPSLHPQERAHEYVRALNAVKLEKAKFVTSSLLCLVS